MELNQKNSVLVYHDWLSAFETLSAEESKQLIIAIIKYSMSDTEPDQHSASFNMAWLFIKQTLQRDKESYLEKCKTNAENGAKGGRPKKAIAKNENRTETEKTERFTKKAKKADNDSDNDNDNDNDSDNDSDNDTYSFNETLCNFNAKQKMYGTHQNIPLSESKYEQYKTQHSNIDELINQYSEKVFNNPSIYKPDYFNSFLMSQAKSNITEAAPPKYI